MDLRERRLAVERAPHFVYELWGERDCYYVGMSATPATRIGTHAAKPWWAAVVHIVANRHPDRQSARRAESEAIDKHQPLYNWQGAQQSAGSRTGVGHGGAAFLRSDVLDA